MSYGKGELIKECQMLPTIHPNKSVDEVILLKELEQVFWVKKNSMNELFTTKTHFAFHKTLCNEPAPINPKYFYLNLCTKMYKKRTFSLWYL